MNRFVLLAAAGCMWGQAPAVPTFDAASIKASENNARGDNPMGRGGNPFASNIQTTPGSVSIRGLNFKGIVGWAYKVLPVQVTGPEWMDSQRFDIMARSLGPTDTDGLRAMMRTLLAQRFNLAAHRETKEMPVYVLSVGKGGSKLQESTEEGEASLVPDQKTFTVNIAKTPVSQLIELLTQFFRAPVLDETGLKGKYDLKLNVAKYMGEMQGGGGMSMDPQTLIVQILQNDLGLKLEPKKAPVELVVVDKSDKTPGEN